MGREHHAAGNNGAHRAGRPGPSGHRPGIRDAAVARCPPHKWLQRNLSLFKMLCMTKDNDPKAYIEAFEWTATVLRPESDGSSKNLHSSIKLI